MLQWLNTKSKSDDCKKEVLNRPSPQICIKMLLEECYQECGAASSLLEYFEAHGTGTKVTFIKCVRQTGLEFRCLLQL
jgi:hypothetical protein